MSEKISYNVQQAADAIGVHPRTIYDAMRDCQLAYLEIGRRKLIFPEALKEWLITYGQPKR
ncbi:helix-turn-helix domain-containing protein [Nocardia sp. FBN12]|uniref:helix-turn-helix domain-containing protein n=1 Tax=Nocardia sp. FBN12 TaxID=3419766 RepID=UPI003D0802DE